MAIFEGYEVSREMTRSSTATVRAVPMAAVTKRAGPVIVHADSFKITSEQRIQIVDITEQVATLARAAGVREGIATLCSLHTTTALFVNEHQDALVADYETFLTGIVDAEMPWKHNNAAHSDCVRFNTAAHLRALVLGRDVTIQVNGGELVLGGWQRILFAELDGPQVRTLRLSVLGVA
jgi:secondary thiamine-phosphate synthase enzyme